MTMNRDLILAVWQWELRWNYGGGITGKYGTVY